MKRITIQVAPVLIPGQYCGKRQKQHVMVKAQVMTASLVMEADYLITANAAMHLPDHKGSWFVAPIMAPGRATVVLLVLMMQKNLHAKVKKNWMTVVG